MGGKLGDGRSASGVYWRGFFFHLPRLHIGKQNDRLATSQPLISSYVLKIERSELQSMRSRSERTKKSRGITNQEKY